MKKVTLHLEQLAVESFPTTNEPWARRGTVRGNDSATVDQDSCVTCGASCATCNATCPNTCPATCASTCPQSCDPAQCPSADGRC
ncbi:MAG TPA: hypothetical protein VHG08_08740 [Longimicrobium sp.]|nr:hypothetical protein [Longimicrobium sp.]